MDNKTMSDYTLYCTEEQTKKALALGAPIEKTYFALTDSWQDKIPTAEQMIGWLRTKKLYLDVCREDGGVFSYAVLTEECEGTYDIESDINYFNTYKEATLASINVALEYLTLNGVN